MRSVKIAEAKAQLSKHIRYVRTGGRVVIYDRDQPVARLVPYEDEADATDEQVRADLIKRGILTPAKIPGGTKLPPLRSLPKDPTGSVVAALLEERRKGR